MILADENIDSCIVEFLSGKGISIKHIKTEHPGIDDKSIIEMAKNPPRIILTEDKDFGEWVFAHHEKNISVILLRYSADKTQEVISVLSDLILERGEKLFNKFTTVTPHKIRIRSLR